MHLLPVRAVAVEGLPIFGAHAPGPLDFEQEFDQGFDGINGV